MGFLMGLGTIICVFIVVLYVYLKKRFSYFAERGIPHVEATWPLGNTWRSSIFKENMIESIDRIYRENPGKNLLGFYHGVMPALLVTSPETLTEVTIKNFSHFYDRGFSANEDMNPLDNHLINLTGSKWRTLRKKLTPTFTTGKLRGMLPIMEESVDNFITTIQEGVDLEMKGVIGKLALHIIGSCAFGIDSESINRADSQFISACNKFSNPGVGLFLRSVLNFAYPSLARALGVKTWPEDMNRFFFNIVHQGFELRKNKKYARNDFLQLLLELKERGEIKLDEQYEDDSDNEMEMNQLKDEKDDVIVLDEVLLTAQAFVFLIGGYETTSTNLAFVCYLLSKNSEAQKTARKEIKEVKTKHGSFTYNALKELVYLDACIKESLRMYPPIGMIARKCTKAITLEGIDIEKGTFVFLPSYSIHNDPTHFPEPAAFNPERFLQHHNTTAFFPFGSGPRTCIGQRFANLEMILTLAKLLDTFEIDTAEKMREFEPIKLAPVSFVTAPKDGLFCKLKKI